MFVALLFFLLMLITSFSFFDQEKDIKTFLIYAACVVCLFLLAGFRPYGVDEDSMNYLSLYYNAESELIEPSFFLISNTVSRVFNDPRGVFVIYLRGNSRLLHLLPNCKPLLPCFLRSPV